MARSELSVELTELLHAAIARGTPTYAATAQRILDAPGEWSTSEVTQFVDGFLNDPYLTRAEPDVNAIA